MVCKKCNKEVKEENNSCPNCGTLIKNDNTLKKILNIFKNILRVFIMFWLSMFVLIYILDGNWFLIFYILCFLMLIPKIANLLYKKLKLNRIIKYVIIVILFMIATLNISTTSVTNESDNSNNDTTPKTTTTTKQTTTTTKQTTTTTTRPTTTVPPTTTRAIFDENNINEVISCNEKRITIVKMKRLTKKENRYVPDGKEYIGIHILFENKSQRDMNYYETDFHLVNDNGQVLDPSFYILEGMFDRERLNSGTLTPGGKKEGYVMFGNDTIADKSLKLRITCQNNLILDDEIRTIKLYN